MPESPLQEPNPPFQRVYFQTFINLYIFVPTISIIIPKSPLRVLNYPFQRAYFLNFRTSYIFTPIISIIMPKTFFLGTIIQILGMKMYKII